MLSIDQGEALICLLACLDKLTPNLLDLNLSGRPLVGYIGFIPRALRDFNVTLVISVPIA